MVGAKGCVFIEALFFCRFGAYGHGLETASSGHGDLEDSPIKWCIASTLDL
jgi:hypothetical protein